jgi:single-strand DNA-binding protein
LLQLLRTSECSRGSKDYLGTCPRFISLISWGAIRYRAVEEDGECRPFKHSIAEIYASGMRRLSKGEAADDPINGADEE